jgi:hypothetical protein
MLVKNVVRGNPVTFTSTFVDENNEVMTPADPIVRVYYKSNNVYVTVTLTMTAANATAWSATWVSSNADIGVVRWHISAGSSTPATQDGDFRILSNKANGGPGAT